MYIVEGLCYRRNACKACRSLTLCIFKAAAYHNNRPKSILLPVVGGSIPVPAKMTESSTKNHTIMAHFITALSWPNKDLD